METFKKYVLFAHPVLSLALCGLCLFCLRSYETEREARIKVEATIDAQKGVLAREDQVIKDSQQAMKDRDAATAKTVEALTRVQAKPPASPVETAAQIAKYLSLSSPPAVEKQEPGVRSQESGEKPGLVFSAPQAEELRKASVGCADDQAKLTGCERDMESLEAQIAALKENLRVVTGERDAALKALKGGGFFARLKRDAQSAGVGIALGVAADELIKHR